MAAESRWGRRKQKNPRRKDEEDPAVEQGMNTLDSQIDPESSVQSCQTNHKAANSTCPEELKPLDVKPLEESCHDSSLDALESPTCMTRTEEGLSQESDMEQSSLTGDKDDEESNVTGDGNKSEDESTNSLEEKKEGSEEKAEESEEEKIQELMNRSDTAVIFPEPVSDQEDNLENEDENDEDGDSDEKHSCPQCGVAFVLKVQLEKHMALHSPTSQSCKICMKTFANVYRLQRHMISHEESSDLRKFKCIECGKAFKFKHHLKEHTRIHSGEKPFECPNCGKRFSHSGSYSSHMTSKKCWVVNLKMRGRGDKTPEKQEGILRPLVPKAGENGIEMGNSPMYSMYPQQFIPFDPSTAASLQSHLIAHSCMNGNRPFLPHVPFNVGQMINPMMPGLPVLPHGFPAIPDIRDLKAFHHKLQQQQYQLQRASKDEDNQESKENSTMEPSEKTLDVNQNKDIVNKDSISDTSHDDQVEKTNEVREEKSDAESLTKDESVEEKMEVDEDKARVEQDNHLNAVKKVLEIVGATVSQQQKNSEDKAALSKLTPPLAGPEANTSSLNALAAAAEKMQQQMQLEQDRRQEQKSENRNNTSSQQKCRFCSATFCSPIDLHQHERYLCKLNQDIQINQQGEVHSRNGALTPSSICTDRTDEDNSEVSSAMEGVEQRKCRGRSMINEEQQQLLKSFYCTNPRPTKIDLERLAAQIGFPKRVVQVWFQNMRARDRRKGRQIPDGPHPDVPSTSTTSAYIPVVPQYSVAGNIFYASPKTNCHPASTVSNGPNPSQNASPMQSEQPLDLSKKKEEPQQAHLNQSFRRSLSPQAENGEVLNLSLKDKPDSASNIKVEESAIFKYMKQEGMFGAEKTSPVGHGRPSPVPTAGTSPPAINTTPAHSKIYTSMYERACREHSSTPPHIALPPQSPSLVSSAFSPPPSSLDTSFHSTHSLDSLDLQLNGKAKRARKKSWRQVESEELQMDFEDGMDGEEDSLFRKKRRSWKHHKVDSGEGMYACDQCDKMFNKQSSLARHKYEHSGQRPFPCDICGKAFKHKHHLTEHKRLHSGEKPFICKKCGKRFSHSGSFSQHMNHRYKYCKPLRLGLDCEMDADDTLDEEDEFPRSTPEDASVPE